MMSSGSDSSEGTARIARLRGEIGRVIEREYALVWRCRDLAASFEALMPDPKQRHDAALLALSATLKQTPQEIGAALIGQQQEIAQLQQAVAGPFGSLGAPGIGIPGAAAPSQQGAASLKHCPKCGEPLIRDRYEDRWICRSCSHEVEPAQSAEGGPKREAAAPIPATVEKDLQKACPQCGGVMHYLGHDELWQCYTCAHEEEAPENAQEMKEASAASTAGPQDDIIPGKVAITGSWAFQKSAAKTRVCPVCKKKMDWYEQEKRWKCFFCGHKTR